MTHTSPLSFMTCSECLRSTNELWGTRCPACHRKVFGENAGPPTLGDAVMLTKALETMGMVAGDLKDQRDAREEECAELRGHVRNLIEALVGKVRAKGEISRRVRAAEEYLMRPRHSAPMARRVSPQAKEKDE